jgi:hypothetical protein
MENIDMNIDGNILTIKIDLSKEFGPSSSGKTIVVASTRGNANVDGHPNIKLGVNCFKYPEKK